MTDGMSDVTETVRLIDALKERGLVAATIRVGIVEVRLGGVVSLEEPEEESPRQREAREATLAEERLIAQYAASLGGVPTGDAS